MTRLITIPVYTPTTGRKWTPYRTTRRAAVRVWLLFLYRGLRARMRWPVVGRAVVLADMCRDGETLRASRNALPRLLDDHARARALLKRIERSATVLDGHDLECSACPECLRIARHAPDCELAALIGGR